MEFDSYQATMDYMTVFNGRFFLSLTVIIIMASVMGFLFNRLREIAPGIKLSMMCRSMGVLTLVIIVAQYFLVGPAGMLSGGLIGLIGIYIYASCAKGYNVNFLKLFDPILDEDEKDKKKTTKRTM